MMARGFKPVGWVAGVASAALSCYMLSLNVAAERAELAKLERQIVTAKSDIRMLQTELGTRGRLQQLESWNANVLALSAPTSAQFLESELTLARFEPAEQTLEERSTSVRMAAAPAAPAEPNVQQKIQAPVRYASAPARPKPAQPLVHQASLAVEAKPAPVQPKAAEKPKQPQPVKVASAEKKQAPQPQPAGTEKTAEKKPAEKTAEKKTPEKKPAEKTAEKKTAEPKKVAEKKDPAPGKKAAAADKSGSAGGQ